MSASASLGPIWLALAVTALPTAAIEAAHVARRLPVPRGRAITGIAVGRALAVGAGVPAAWWSCAVLAGALPPGEGWNAIAVAHAVPWLPEASAQPLWLFPVVALLLLVPCAVLAFAIEWAVGALVWPRVAGGAIARTVAGAILRSHALLAGVALAWLVRRWWMTM